MAAAEGKGMTDGPLLTSATNALQELVFSVNSARGDMANATAVAQAEITAKLRGTSAAAAAAFKEAAQIAAFFEEEANTKQAALEEATQARVEAEKLAAKHEAEKAGAVAELAEAQAEAASAAAAAKQREQALADENRRLRTAQAESSGDAEQTSAISAELKASLAAAEGERDTLSARVSELEALLSEERTGSEALKATVEKLGADLQASAALAEAATPQVESMQHEKRELRLAQSEALAAQAALEQELVTQQAAASAALEQERASHQQQLSELRLEAAAARSPREGAGPQGHSAEEVERSIAIATEEVKAAAAGITTTMATARFWPAPLQRWVKGCLRRGRPLGAMEMIQGMVGSDKTPQTAGKSAEFKQQVADVLEASDEFWSTVEGNFPASA